MVDLSTLQGSSLVPQVTDKFQDRLVDIFQDVSEKREIEKLSGVQTETQERASLLRLSQLDPAVSASVQGVLKRRDDKEILALQKQADTAFKFSTFLGGIKNFGKQSQEIEKRIAELQAEPGTEDRVNQLIKLRNMGKDERNLTITKSKTLSSDVKSVAEAEKARIALEKTNQEKRFLQNALTAQQIQAAPPLNQADLLEDQALQEEQKGNAQGAQVWRSIAGMDPGPARDQALRQIQNMATTKLTPTKIIEPKGDLAVANQQLAAGNITPAQFNQIVKNVEEKQKSGLIKDLTAAGIKFDENGLAVTEDGRQLIRDIKLKPAVVIRSSLKPEKGFQPKNPKAWENGDYSEGVEPTPGGAKERLSPEKAAKVSMLVTAKAGMGKAGDVLGVDGLVYKTKDKLDANGQPILDNEGLPVQEFALDKNGDLDVDRVNVSQGTFGEGRELKQRMELGIQAITRGETGAAMPAEEVENTRIRFMPKFLDSDKMIATKLRLFREFINGSLKLIDPSGRFQEERFQTEVNKKMGNSPRTRAEQNAPKSGNVGKFSFTVEP